MAVSDRRAYNHIVDNAFDMILEPMEPFPRRLSQAEELIGVHSGERHYTVRASPFCAKIVRPRYTLTPEQGLPTGDLADINGLILVSELA